MSDPRRLALVLPLALLAGACSSTMAIRSVEPGRVLVGPARHLAILDGEGRRSAREFVNAEITAQARAWGYFSAEDRSEEGVEVRLAGRRAMVEWHGGEPLGSFDAGLRVDVLEWGAVHGYQDVSYRDDKGLVYVETVPVQQATVLLAVTLFEEEGRTMLAEAEYEGVFETEDMLAPRESVIEDAARHAIHHLLADITPVEVVSHVRLDEEDEAQAAILETAKAGAVAQAADDMGSYLERNPRRASAAYNLAVFLEATGRFDEALEIYDRALSLGGKGYYAAARAQCARRLSAAEALEPRPSAR